MEKFRFKIQSDDGVETEHVVFIDTENTGHPIQLDYIISAYLTTVSTFDFKAFVRHLRNILPDTHIHGEGLMPPLAEKLSENVRAVFQVHEGGLLNLEENV